MTGRVLDFVRSPHRRTQELLPWFLNGTLEGDEAHQVEEHLRACPACRSELECLTVLRADYIDSEMAPEAKAAFARLRPRLMDEATPASRAPRRAAPRARQQRGPIPAWTAAGLAPIPAWVKVALAAQMVLIFGLGWQALQADRSASAFHVLSQPGAPERASGSLVVVFDPNAPQRDVARILHGTGGRVVDGPTGSNGYVVAVPDGSLNVALTRLRAEPAVVLAEPLQLESPR
ncbi:MAG TPA: zf-HC2 domain-containing protein [Burkholderiaceae bacterium]